MSNAWQGCETLAEFPKLLTGTVKYLDSAWYGCLGLESFPLIDTTACLSVESTWNGCTKLPAFPPLIFSSVENLSRAWAFCSSLTTFPDNMFNTTGTLAVDAFDEAWLNCALNKDSIENILVSLDTNGASSIVLGIDGGTNAAKSTWTAAANTAYTNLIGKGWTITFNA